VRTNISARHGQLSAKTQEKVAEKVEKLSRFFERVTSIDVTINLERDDDPEVEITVSAEHADRFVGSERAGGFWPSIDGAVHKLEQQLRKHKEKIISSHRKPGAKRQVLPEEPTAGGEGA